MRKAKEQPSSRSTRERVLDLACALFNQHGAERVTTRRIADAAAINEGNLYYYFRTKEALIVALFGRFEAAAGALLEAPLPETASDPAPYSHILRGWFLLSWEFRFLFQDMLFLQNAVPVLQEPLRTLARRLGEATRAVFVSMREAGLIAIEPEELDRLLANLRIVSTYWVSSLLLQDGAGAVTPEHLNWGYAQVRSLYAPYLTSAARTWIEQNSATCVSSRSNDPDWRRNPESNLLGSEADVASRC